MGVVQGTFLLAVLLLLTTLAPRSARADEPGEGIADEPGISATLEVPKRDLPMFRIDLAFGFASLLEDPDVKQGYGGGINAAWGMHNRVGIEANIFVSNNNYSGDLGSIGSTFLSGNISAGPFVQLTRPGSRLYVTAEALLGAYMIAPAVQETIWTLGIGFGMSLGYRITSWFGIGVRVRYHLFNLANISGPELRDIKAFMKVGVIDRMEIPAYVAFYF
ncbi:MAG: hypothetical protein KC503_21195 [Myxococcales bacterium]|nr:hypothetical protein [Myxococcales bacterium]